jgi:hypothetical protein
LPLRVAFSTVLSLTPIALAPVREGRSQVTGILADLVGARRGKLGS